MKRPYRLCLAQMKAVLGVEHACRWLVDVTRYPVTELQEPLLRYVTREWRSICDENLESTELLEKFPSVLRTIMVRVADKLPRAAKRRRTV